MNANLETAISDVHSGLDYFFLSGISITIALMCLSVIFLTHKARLSAIALSSAEFASNSAANAPLVIRNDASGEADKALPLSHTFAPADRDNSRTLEWSPSSSNTLNQSSNSATLGKSVEKAEPPARSRTKTNRKVRRYAAKARIRTSWSFSSNLRRFVGWLQLK